MDVNVTVGAKSCEHELRGDVVICPLPSSLQLGKDSAPLQVGSSAGPSEETWAKACRRAGSELPLAPRSVWMVNVTSWAE